MQNKIQTTPRGWKDHSEPFLLMDSYHDQAMVPPPRAYMDDLICESLEEAHFEFLSVGGGWDVLRKRAFSAIE